MSRGLSRQDKDLLARVKQLRPGQQIQLLHVLGNRPTADQWDSARRRVKRLEEAGLLRLDGRGRELVVRPPDDRQISDKFRVAEVAGSDTYRGPKSHKTSGRVSVGNEGLCAGLARDDIAVLLWAIEQVLAMRGLCSQADRESLQRVHEHFRTS